jgi:excisionase family DNA binding protein
MCDVIGRIHSLDPSTAYSRQEAADALGVSLRTLKRLLGSGLLRTIQPGEAWPSQRILITGDSLIATLNQTLVDRTLIERLSKP